MDISILLDVLGLVVSSFLFAFAVAGLWDSGHSAKAKSAGLTAAGMLFLMVCLSLTLIDPPAISPAWLQYSVLVGLPLLAGFILRRIVSKWWSRQNEQNNHQA